MDQEMAKIYIMVMYNKIWKRFNDITEVVFYFTFFSRTPFKKSKLTKLNPITVSKCLVKEKNLHDDAKA